MAEQSESIKKAVVTLRELSEDEKALIESVTLDTGENTLRELQSLIAKEKDLEKRIKELNTDTTARNATYTIASHAADPITLHQRDM